MGSHWYRHRNLGGGLGGHGPLDQEEGSIEEKERRSRRCLSRQHLVSSTRRLRFVGLTLESEHRRLVN